ncbi:tyrosine-type recombinase/integrase [Microbacterium sp. I2]|uniref:tyrosine-type recombinase/integrase n=1 Tax=Microbacterium sp. I2 TaxID=3391826 RepID=UPI003EDB2330
METAKARGDYINPTDARITIAKVGEEWLAARESIVKPSTYHSLRSAWRIHVEPGWGARAVGSLRHSTPLRVACAGKDSDELVFGKEEGHHRRPQSQDGWFAAAVKRAQKDDPTFPRISPHDLRHTVASLAISAGANVKAVQRMLGHASAAMTLDTYADLFDDDLDRVSAALDQARSSSIVATVLPPDISE